jgi:hypothetical protein
LRQAVSGAARPASSTILWLAHLAPGRLRGGSPREFHPFCSAPPSLGGHPIDSRVEDSRKRTEDKIPPPPAQPSGRSVSIEAHDPREALFLFCLLSQTLLSPPQAAGTNPGPIPVRLIRAAAAFWCPASNESGEHVLEEFALPRRFCLALERKFVFSCIRILRHAHRFRTTRLRQRTFDLPFECPQGVLRPSFPRNPLGGRSLGEATSPGLRTAL